MSKNEKIIALLILAAAVIVWYLLRRQGVTLGVSAGLNLGRAQDDMRAREDMQITDPALHPQVPDDVWADATPVYQSYNVPQGFTPADPMQSYFTAAQVQVALAPAAGDDAANLQSVNLPVQTWIQ